MSFIGDISKGSTYNSGGFLAYGDEEVIRETREFSQNSPLVVIGVKGDKHIPMGTAYPTNDENAVGISYEDVDVTVGNMPGSVVTGNAVVYEDKLAITGESYDTVTPKGTENPVMEEWYERSGSEGAYVYTLTTDTTVDVLTTYYEKTAARLSPAAQTALTALGFKFISSAPVVTRPY